MPLEKIGILTNLSVLNETTGELIPVRVVALREKLGDKAFAKVFNAFTRDLIENEKLAGKAIRLLFYILDRLDYNELLVFLKPEEVIKELKISRATFFLWRKALIEEQILLPTKLKSVYMLNPNKVFVGSVARVKAKLPQVARALGIDEESLEEILLELEEIKRPKNGRRNHKKKKKQAD